MLLNQNCVYLKALLRRSAALFVLLLVLLAARGGRHRSGSLLVLRIVLAMGITIPLVCLILSLVLPLILVAVIRLTRLPWLTRPIRRLSRRVLLLVGVLLLVRLRSTALLTRVHCHIYPLRIVAEKFSSDLVLGYKNRGGRCPSRPSGLREMK